MTTRRDTLTTKRIRIRKVLLRHARISNGGRPAVCGPTDGKQYVIFNTEKDALDAAAEFAKLHGTVQYASRCPRSRRGHHHLVGERPAAATQKACGDPDPR